MKTSARNQYLGKVTRVTQGAVNDEVQLKLPGGQEIVAIVTHESSATLGLAEGVDCFALVKASSVIVMTELDGARFSARNCLQGQVARVQVGAVNSEVVLALPGGAGVAAVITNESVKALGLETGMQAWAMFKASSVIVGVPA